MASIQDDLETLRLHDSDVKELSVSEVIRAFRKMAKEVHPDRTQKDTNREFQDLSNAYQRILTIAVENAKKEHDSSTEDKPAEENNGKDDVEQSEEVFMNDNFHNFNFPTEKEGNFVVVVQNALADAWSQCFEDVFGKPTVNTRENNI